MPKSKYPEDCQIAPNNPLYLVWLGMKHRVKPGYKDEHRYFKRGICLETMLWTYWPNFCRWAKANGYAPGLWFDRRDNDRGYHPDNCRFVTNLESTRNRDHANMVAAIKKQTTKFHSKPFVCNQTGQVFETEIEASRVLNVERRMIGRQLRGIFKQAKGFTFKYMDNTNRRGRATSAI